MHELHAILDATRAPACADDAVLVTVVHVTGSAYRRPGARMLIEPAGRRIGTVSGGCLEGEIARKAWWWTAGRRPVVRVYDTTSEDDAVWAFGLGCNGVVHVMLERVHTATTQALLRCLDEHRRRRETVVVATVAHSDGGSGAAIGDRLFVNAEGIAGGSLADHPLASSLLPVATQLLPHGPACLAHLDACDVFVERIAPPVDLIIFGAGDDAAPLVAMASQLGWHVSVADGRPAYARADRFPGADRVVLLPPGNPTGDLTIDHDSVVVMMTHNYVFDRRLLLPVLGARPRYLGLLGPRARAERLFDEVGCRIPSYVHAPVGLDIGAETPAAVALSVVAEVQSVLAGRSAQQLTLRDAPIHEPVREMGAASWQEAWSAERPAHCESSVVSGA